MEEVIDSEYSYNGIPESIYEYDRILGITDGIALNINNIVGSGIFLIPGNVWRLVKYPGTALFVWISGGYISFLGSWIYAELSVILPNGAGELKYFDEAFSGSKRLFVRIFSYIMIFIMRPILIVFNACIASQYLIYAILGKNQENQSGYFSKGYVKFAARINAIFAVFKILALTIIVIVGLIQLQNVNFKNHWINVFENTSDNRSYSQRIGSYGYAMLETLIAYEGWSNANYLADKLINPQRSVRVSNIYSIIITIILYILVNISYITVVSPEDAVMRGDVSQIIAMYFGNTLVGETGKILISLLIVISSCGTISTLIDSGSRIIVYAVRNNLIIHRFRFLYFYDERFHTPKNALLFQLFYCMILTIFLTTNAILVTTYYSLYQIILYHCAAAIGLMILMKKFPTFYVSMTTKSFCVSFLLCMTFIAIIMFFPPPSDEIDIYFAYVISWFVILVGIIVSCV
ncbi:amino acid transporter [Gigaspora margarita]|uniref:Amino acid transporter n=1 Tax=Gigaspora margarita TaxID=4874 RepID=A0A8H4ATR1_GIGMA|nr:amino acid transporter [Gigaspora margarita]